MKFLGVADRTVPSVDLWTTIPSSEVTIDNQPRTYEATNTYKPADLPGFRFTLDELCPRAAKSFECHLRHPHCDSAEEPRQPPLWFHGMPTEQGFAAFSSLREI